MLPRFSVLTLPNETILEARHRFLPAHALVIVGLVALGAALVYLTGGTRFSYLHLLYLPIVLAALYFRIYGGLLCGILAGLAVGPLMPLNVDTGLHQPTISWAVRLGMFVIVGTFTGMVFGRIGALIDRERRLAQHASWSGLPNAGALFSTLRQRLASPHAADLVLVVARINNLSDVTYNMGNGTAGSLLYQCADRLSEVSHGASAIFDLNQGDLAFLLDLKQASLAQAAAEIKKLAAEPIEVNSLPIFADISFGTAVLEPAADATETIRRAYIALNTAILRGTVHRDYDPRIDVHHRDQLAVLADFSQAMRNDQLIVHYQPKIDLQHENAVGVEALLRWEHPTRGLLSPGLFIPLVEKTSLIHGMTHWLTEHALRHVAAWWASGVRLSVAINLSARNLRDPDFIPLVERLLRELDLPSTAVEFELTETDVLHADDEARETLAALKRLGARISIDDFGTGYSSLAHFAQLPIDCIKIDQTFIRGMIHDRRLHSIVVSMVEMARRLNVAVVAEGIEDSVSLDALKEIGVEIGQGYYFARPLPEGDLLTWIRERSNSSRPPELR